MSETPRTSVDALLELAPYLPAAGTITLVSAVGASCCGGLLGATAIAPVTLLMLAASLVALRASEPGSEERIASSRAVMSTSIAVAVVPIGACLGLALAMFGGGILGFLTAAAGY